MSRSCGASLSARRRVDTRRTKSIVKQESRPGHDPDTLAIHAINLLPPLLPGGDGGDPRLPALPDAESAVRHARLGGGARLHSAPAARAPDAHAQGPPLTLRGHF